MLKRTVLLICSLFIAVSAMATQWMTYYVYFEKEHAQGLWNSSRKMEEEYNKKGSLNYMQPVLYEDLMGTEDIDIAKKFMSRLKELKPQQYSWKYELNFKGDTVQFILPVAPDQFETIQHEITYTFTLNGFREVSFTLPDTSFTVNHSSFTLPYFDLVLNDSLRTLKDVVGDAKLPSDTLTNVERKNFAVKTASYQTWLYLSLGINLLLLIGLLYNKYNR